MPEVCRKEYRAYAVDPARWGNVRYEGSIASSAHGAHLNLEEEWEPAAQEVRLEMRYVHETEWRSIANA